MNWFSGLSTRSKLMIGFGAVIALFVMVMASSLRSITIIRGYQNEMFSSEYANTVEILNLRAFLNEIRTDLLAMMLTKSDSERDQRRQSIKENAEQIEKLTLKLKEKNDEAIILTKLSEFESVLKQFTQTRDTKLIPLIYSGKADQARALAMGVQNERYQRMRAVTDELVAAIFKETERHVAASEQSAMGNIKISMAIGVAVIVMSVLIALYLNALISRPLKDISLAAERISSGDLTTAAPAINRPDEVGILSQTFRSMTERLQKQTKDILEAVHVLASSSNEIAATTVQLASGTEQTAVAVTETTTTVEEVKQTANLSTQKAKQVSDLAHNAAMVSQNGARMVAETVAGVSNIREQMEYIAETIVKLSEHNQAIGEIIAAVDDLAEQSNLLAVNASIEAAKVGEQGKGFAVVAQEIKSLAEQSKQATKQVRTILNDIQKASTAAVMATEKGSKAVDATVKQSSGTGESIQELSRAITEASQAVMQIAASSQQQLVGMDQVAIAMTNIRQAAAQNAASTKQVEITVRNLQEIGQKLKVLVERYRV